VGHNWRMALRGLKETSALGEVVLRGLKEWVVSSADGLEGPQRDVGAWGGRLEGPQRVSGTFGVRFRVRLRSRFQTEFGPRTPFVYPRSSPFEFCLFRGGIPLKSPIMSDIRRAIRVLFILFIPAMVVACSPALGYRPELSAQIIDNGTFVFHVCRRHPVVSPKFYYWFEDGWGEIQVTPMPLQELLESRLAKAVFLYDPYAPPKDGRPVSREVKVLDEVEGAGNQRPTYHPYNKN
jgi:hypothetical protein